MPALRIDIEAAYAKFTDSMSKIEASAKKSAGGIESAFKGVNGTLAGLGVGISVAGLAAIVRNAIDAADHLNDLSKKTGVAVESIGAIGFAASQAGSNLDGAAAALGKLNIAIAKAGAGNQETAEAFKKLGLDVRDSVTGNLKQADTMLVEIAGAFEKYKDGPNKAALANAFFSKSYADMLPLLADGGKALQDTIDYYKKYSQVSTDLAKKSDAFNDDLGKLKLLAGAAGNQIAGELLPALSQITNRMLNAKESAEGFGGTAKVVGTAFKGIVIGVNSVAEAASAAATHLGAMAAIAGRLADLDFSGAKNVGKEYLEDQMKRWEEFKKFTVAVATGAVANNGGPAPGTGNGDGGGDGRGDAPGLAAQRAEQLKSRRLDEYLRGLERESDRVRTILGNRNQMLQDYYRDDLLSIEQYYDARQAAANEALKQQQANIDKEIAALRKSIPKDDELGRLGVESKIKDLQAKRSQLEVANNTETTRALIDRAADAKAFAAQLEGINTQLLEMQGRFEKVAATRFDAEHAKSTKQLGTARAAAVEAGDTGKVAEIDEALKQLEIMRDATVAQGRLNELQTEAGRIQSDLQIATERVDAAVQAGTIGELEGLRQVGEARKQAAIDLLAMADSFKDAAKRAADPRFAQMAKEFEAAAQKMANSADLVRDRFQDVFQHGFEGMFNRLLSGTVSLKDAMRGLIAEISADLSRLAIKDLSNGLFSKGGSLSGLVNLAASFFGGSGVASSATYASMDWLASAHGNVFKSGNLVPFANGGIPGVVSSPTTFPMSGGRTGLMGEAGPEAIMPLHRDALGELAVKMVGDRGEKIMLPLTRDAAGKLSVKAPNGKIRAFANGGVFSAGSLSPTFSTNAAGALNAAMATRTGGWMATTEHNESIVNQHFNVTVPPGTSRESADQIANRTAIAVERARRRNG